MTNTFRIVITASDKATATVRKVKESIAQFTKPIRDVKASVGALGRELGIDKMAARLGNAAKAARGVAIGALKVVGAVAAIAGVGSLAAMAAFTRTWALAGAEVMRTRAILGTTAEQLQTLRGASEAAGLSAGDLTAGLKAIGDTMEDALFGRNQTAAVLMQRLGIQMHKTKEGSVDVVRGLYDIADAITKTKNVQAQGLIARTFGVEQLLPLLQKGAAGIKEYEAAVKRSGAVMGGPALKASQDLQLQLALLKLSATGLANSILGQLAPSFVPIIKGLGDWTQKNRENIASGLKGYLDTVTGAVNGVAGAIDGVVRATVGWQGAALILTGILAGRFLLSIVGLIAPIATVTARIGILAFTALPGLALRAGIAAESLGLSGLAGTFLRLGVIMDGLPIGWILTGLAGIYVAWRKIREQQETAEHGGEGWKGSLAGTPSQMSGKPGAGGARVPINRGNVAAAMAFFQKQGWSRNQAAGMVANLAYESSLNPGQEGDNGAAYGIGQWHKARQQAFKRLIGHDIRGSTLSEQLRFMQFELTQGGERRAGKEISAADTASKAAQETSYNYERPANPLASLAVRQGIAEALAKDPSAGTLKGGGGKVEVHFKNAPPGTQVKASPASPGGQKPGVKVDFAMPEMSG